MKKYNISKASELLGVSPQTLRNWDKNNILKPSIVMDNGYRYYTEKDISDFLGNKYTFEKLLADPDNIEENFRDYLNGFSDNVQNIIDKFKFDGHITTMANKGILYIVIKEFTCKYL